MAMQQDIRQYTCTSKLVMQWVYICRKHGTFLPIKHIYCKQKLQCKHISASVHSKSALTTEYMHYQWCKRLQACPIASTHLVHRTSNSCGLFQYIGNTFRIISFSSASSVVGSPGKSQAPYRVHLLITLSPKTALRASLTANVVALDGGGVYVPRWREIPCQFPKKAKLIADLFSLRFGKLDWVSKLPRLFTWGIKSGSKTVALGTSLAKLTPRLLPWGIRVVSRLAKWAAMLPLAVEACSVSYQFRPCCVFVVVGFLVFTSLDSSFSWLILLKPRKKNNLCLFNLSQF